MLLQFWLQYPPDHRLPDCRMHSAPVHCEKSVQAEPVGLCVGVWQVPLVQVPVVQVLPAQHGWLAPPHAAQVLPWQMKPVLHMLPEQHDWPAPPHTTVRQ